MVVPTQLVEAEVDVEQVLEVRKRTGPIRVPVRLTLNNVSEVCYVLHAPSAGQETFWHVLDENHKETLREQPRKPRSRRGMEGFRGKTLAAGFSDHATVVLVLEASDLQDGHTYTVRVEMFGQIGEAEFVAVLRPAPAPKKRPATKPAKKRSARR